ncbi:MAG: M23 family metallopeptidase [Thermales bacterium]|nr:M23 family metallopeptidase [Thermales bacterium]
MNNVQAKKIFNLFEKFVEILLLIFLPSGVSKFVVKAAVKPVLIIVLSLLILPVVFLFSLTNNEVGAVSSGSDFVPPPTIIREIGELNRILDGYIEEGFDDSPSPIGKPFGFGNSSITAGFRDAEYLKTFEKPHDGVDYIPNENYYANNTAYKITKFPILFSTCSGEGVSKIDQHGGKYVDISCNDNIHRVILLHNTINLIPYTSPTQITAGQPVGIMGSTGYSTGAHVHYQIWENGEIVDPTPYTILHSKYHVLFEKARSKSF